MAQTRIAFTLVALCLLGILHFLTSSNAEASGPDSLWAAAGNSVSRFDLQTNQLIQTLALSQVPVALATDPQEGSLWVLSATTLTKFDADAKRGFELDLQANADGIDQARYLQLNPYNASVWIANTRSVRQVSRDGGILTQWTSPSDLRALVLDLDESLWVLTRDTLSRRSASGGLLATLPLPALLSEPRALALDSLGQRLWVASAERVLRFDLKNIYASPTPINRPPSASLTEPDAPRPAAAITALGVHPVFGTLWVVETDRLSIYDRDGNFLKHIDLHPYNLGQVDRLVFQPISASLWLGGGQALGQFRGNGEFIARIPLAAKLNALGVAPFKLLPQLWRFAPSASGDLASVQPVIRYGLGGDCAGFPCFPTADYTDSLDLDVRVNDLSIGPPFRRTPYEALFTPTTPLPDGLNRLTAQTTDRYGHASSSLQDTLQVHVTPAPTALPGTPAPGAHPPSTPARPNPTLTAPNRLGVAQAAVLPTPTPTHSTADAPTTQNNPATPNTPAQKTAVSPPSENQPLSFELNRGQVSGTAEFLARSHGQAVFFARGETMMLFKNRKPAHAPRREWYNISRHTNSAAAQESAPRAILAPGDESNRDAERDAAVNAPASAVLHMKLVGRQPAPRVEGLEPLAMKSHYLIGNDPKKWIKNVPHYAKIKYHDVYPGIDQVFYGNDGALEYDLIVHPGADPAQIQLAFDGAEAPRLTPQGDMSLKTPLGTVIHHKPYLYQEVGRARQRVTGAYRLHPSGKVGLEISHYDPSRPLVIDPVLSYATYLGGSAADGANAVALDGQGNTYVTGTTLSTDFPQAAGVPGYHLPASVSGGVFVTKLNATGEAVYTTYFGGTSGMDTGNALAVAPTGHVYVTGNALSTDFPVTAGAIQSQKRGTQTNAFVAKLSADGSALAYATYLGGSSSTGDEGRGIAIDTSGNAYVVGTAYSKDFPTTPTAFHPQKITNVSNAFVAKLNATATQLTYSTYLGSSTYEGGITGGGDSGAGIAVDGNGNAYVTGIASSPDFPTTTDAYQATPGTNLYGTPVYAYVAKLNPTGAGLIYSTLLGGPNEGVGATHAATTRGAAITLDGQGNVIVVGDTSAIDFPATINAYQKTLATRDVTNCKASGCYTPGNAFVTKLNLAVPGADALRYSTFLGGTGCIEPNVSHCTTIAGDKATAVAVDSAGNAYVTGTTSSGVSFPVRYGLGYPYRFMAGYDTPFLVKLDWTPVAVYVTPLVVDLIPETTINGVAVTADGSQTTLVGQTANLNLTTTPNGVQPQSPANKQLYTQNAYLARIDNNGPFTLSLSTSPNPSYSSEGFLFTFGWAGGNQPTGSLSWCEGVSPNPAVCTYTGILNPTGMGIMSSYGGVGTHTYWASYDGDANHAPATSARVIHTIKQGTTVVITAPVFGAKVTSDAPFPVTVQVTSKDTDGNVVRLELYDSGNSETLLQTADAGSNTFAPSHAVTYTFTLPGTTVGNHGYFVRAITDSVPAVTAKSISVLVGASPVQTPPVIAIIAPASGASFTVHDTVVLTIDASSNSGRIKTLEVYDAGTLVWLFNVPYGQDLTLYPIRVPLVVGEHNYSVKATDDLGMSTISNTINVTVVPTPAGLPVVAITTPADGASFTVPANFSLIANASSSVSTLKTLEFFDGTTLWFTLTVPLYTSVAGKILYPFILTPGIHRYTVKATDNAGQSTTSSVVNVTVTGPITAPTTSLTAPAKNAFYITPALISLQASAASTNANATIAKVEFFQGAISLGVSSSAPYNLVWNNVTVGTYNLTVKATDSLGATATSTPVTITVGTDPVVAVPLNGIKVDGDTATVTGNVQTSANSSITVNGLVGMIAPDGSFFVNNVPLAVGVNSLTATITSPDGRRASQTFSVASSGPASFVFRASPTQGLVPLQVNLTLSQVSAPAFHHVDVYCQVAGNTPSLTVPAANLTAATALGSCRYNTPGVYTTKINVVNAAQQVIYTSTQLIQTDALDTQDVLLRNVYTGMLGQLKAGNIASALNAVTAGAYDKYNAVFTAIGPASLATVADQLGTIEDGQIGDGYAEYVVVRNTPAGPQAFLIYLLRGEDGIWRIDGM